MSLLFEEPEYRPTPIGAPSRRRRCELSLGCRFDAIPAWAAPVTFHNPLRDRPFARTVYRARTAIPSNGAA